MSRNGEWAGLGRSGRERLAGLVFTDEGKGKRKLGIGTACAWVA